MVGIVKLPKDDHVHASVLCSFVSYSFGNVRKPSFRGEAGIGVGGMTKYYITGWVILYSNDGIYHEIVVFVENSTPRCFMLHNCLFFSNLMKNTLM